MLQTYLDGSGLPGACPSQPIIERTRLMQHEGQGYYRSPASMEECWTLVWVMLGGQTDRYR